MAPQDNALAPVTVNSTTAPSALLELLRTLGAHQIHHSRSTLLEHLVGTHAILSRWGCSEDTCNAGLFHSIYGTSYFKAAPLSFQERPRIQAQLGEQAERLVWIFCALARAELYAVHERGAPYRLTLLEGQGEVVLSRAELESLAALVWANALEHTARLPATAASRYRERQGLSRARYLLPDRALAELTGVYGEASPPPSLATLLGVEDAGPFIRDLWPEAPFVNHGSPDRLGGFLFDSVQEIFDLKCSLTRAFFRSREGKPTSMGINREQMLPLYNAGATIYLHSVNAERFKPWVHAIDAELGLAPGATRVSGFASRCGLGVPTHYDLNDNFVIQVKGTKRWRIAYNEHALQPTLGHALGNQVQYLHRVEAPNGFPAEMPGDHVTVDLQPGSVLFIPRGWWHDCETIDECSIHFNIQSGLSTWKELAVFFLLEKQPLAGLEMRQGVSHLFENGTLRPERRQELLARIQALVAGLSPEDVHIDEAEFSSFIAKRRGTVP